jgi:hypothetical protein
MATICKEITTKAMSADDVWAIIRDIGALHTRLVPGFVIDTCLEPGVRIVTFFNGMVVREPIVTIDDAAKRLVWTAEGGPTSHYNASAQVFSDDDAVARVVWTADFLPDDAAAMIEPLMTAGMAAMKKALDGSS